jgi:integrase/recombinase XerD
MNNFENDLKRYETYLLLKNFSKQTRVMYLRTIHSFYEFRSSNGMHFALTEEQAGEYLLSRIHAKKAWSTINCDYSALRKFYREVMELPWSMKKIPRPKKERNLPPILSQQDVVKLIEHAPIYKHQVFLTFVYGTGLRLSEALNIEFDDIDSDRLQIRVNKGKGSKDRVVQVPLCLIELLRKYYCHYKPKKYLFNGLRKGNRYSVGAAQWSIKRARTLAGITKTATIHTLRHCYATHHIESGTDLVFLQEQLGHKHLKTTAKYVPPIRIRGSLHFKVHSTLPALVGSLKNVWNDIAESIIRLPLWRSNTA